MPRGGVRTPWGRRGSPPSPPRREGPCHDRLGTDQLGAALGLPAYTDLDRLARETAPALAVVTVYAAANGAVRLMAVEASLRALLEMPLAPTLAEADAKSRAMRLGVGARAGSATVVRVRRRWQPTRLAAHISRATRRREVRTPAARSAAWTCGTP